jgi:hypothetical protein
MPAGIQVWRSNGSLVFDSSDSLSRYVGSFTTGGMPNGAIFLPPGRVWFSAYVANTITAPYIPTFFIDALGRLAWTSDGSPSQNAYVNYGVY